MPTFQLDKTMADDELNKKFPPCFGELETVFPMGKNGLRNTPETCLACRHKTECLRSAIEGAGGLKVREEIIDRAYQSGRINFMERWSKKKALQRKGKGKKKTESRKRGGEIMKTIKDIDLSGKRVFFRVDFNVPLDEHQNITDDSRIRAVLPTLEYALDRNSKLIIASHLGRPKGKPVPEFSLSPVAKRLGRFLGKEVIMAKDCIGSEIKEIVSKMKSGDVVLLENLRFHPEEQKNDDTFAQALAELCDVYINDAFAVSHRVNASVVAITKFAPVSGSGFLLQKELNYFKKAMADPQHPVVAVVGGAKVSSKIGALENMLHHVDKIIIGGAMANTFLKSFGYDLGKSKIENDLVETAGSILRKAAETGIKFYLPVDAVVASHFDAKAEIKIVPIQEIPSEWMVMDIGPATSRLYAEVLYDAKTIIWNGPMGVFEMDAFSRGTFAMANSVANSYALSIVGGGDTDVAIHKSGETDRITYISTGGGAFLALLEGKVLPAVAALDI